MTAGRATTAGVSEKEWAMLQSDPTYKHLEGRLVRRKYGNTNVVGRIIVANSRYLYVRWSNNRQLIRIMAKACVVLDEAGEGDV